MFMAVAYCPFMKLPMTEIHRNKYFLKIEIELGVLLSRIGYFVKVMLLYTDFVGKPLFVFYSVHDSKHRHSNKSSKNT